MKETALDRVQRALDLIPFISAHPGLSIEQIAERFKSSPAQISKDLTLLHMCGLPGYTHLELLDIDYENPDFVSVMEAQVLDKPRSLTQIETLTLVLGLQLLSELSTDAREKSNIQELQKRLKKRLSEEISKRISISDGLVDSPLVADIQKAIGSQRLISLTYNSLTSDQVTSREVFPVELVFKGGVGYLHALTSESREARTFRVDRILEITPGPVTENFLGVLEEKNPVRIHIDLKMGGDGLFFAEKHNEIVTSVSQVDRGYFISLEVNSLEWITRVILSWPELIEILEPRELADELRKRVQETLHNYRRDKI